MERIKAVEGNIIKIERVMTKMYFIDKIIHKAEKQNENRRVRMTRLFMLGFILSRMLQPISFAVFIIFFSIFLLCSVDWISSPIQHELVAFIEPFHAAFILMTLCISLVLISITVHFLFQVLVQGKYVMKLSMLGFLIALAVMQLIVYFCMNLLPNWNGSTILYTSLNSGVLELVSFILMGNLLALYVGVLSRGHFKKNIGFIADTV